MDDTISRQDAIDVLHEYFDGMLDTDTVCPADIYGLFECIPSAQPERKRGKWKMDLKRHVFVCSICGAWQVFNCNYCSNCGTDMREVDE